MSFKSFVGAGLVVFSSIVIFETLNYDIKKRKEKIANELFTLNKEEVKESEEELKKELKIDFSSSNKMILNMKDFNNDTIQLDI